MELLQHTLYYLTSGLLVPCIVFLLFMLLSSMLASGQYLAAQKQQRRAIDALTQWACQTERGELPSIVDLLPCSVVLKEVIGSNNMAANRLLVSHFETDLEQRLSRYSQWAKLGPITGLVGTLIPMGPALQGLANGDIQQLAQQMQIAFTTTVIGLIVGAVGLGLYQVSRRCGFKQLAIIDCVLEQQEAKYAGS